MIKRCTLGLVAILMTGSSPALAETAVSYEDSRARSSGSELPPYLQCVPYAREQSGIQIYGDAHTWWDQAEGKFARGSRPKVGAVMAFQPHRNMQLGHVAAVSKVIDSRTVLLRHSNWSPINGRRGQIERDVKAIDVSPANDWSMVRVWYDPIQDLGSTPWPIHGFIYADKPRSFTAGQRVASAAATPAPAVIPAPAQSSPSTSRSFSNAFAALANAPAPKPAARSTRVVQAARQSGSGWGAPSRPAPARSVGQRASRPTAKADFSDVLAKYDN